MLQVTDRMVQAIAPVSANGAAFTSTVIDTQGFRYLEFLACFGAIGANVTALRVQESDAITNATTLSSGTDVPGAVVGTSVNDAGTTSSLPTTADAGRIWKFEIDLRGRRRYLQIQCTAGAAATLLAAIAKLSRGEVAPTTAAQKGAQQVLRVPVL